MDENNIDEEEVIIDCSDDPPDNYKFISLKLSTDTDKPHPGCDKYRKVFQGPEIDYIDAEYSFHNLLYNISNWDVTVYFEIMNVDTGKTIAKFEKTEKVLKNVSICRTGNGWGNVIKGKSWKKGKYKWCAWIDENGYAEETFYVEDRGFANEDGSPYIKLKEIKFFDANKIKEYGGKRYCRYFADSDRKEINIEITAKNLLKDTCTWTGEFIFLVRSAPLGGYRGQFSKVITFYNGDINFSCKIKRESIGSGAAHIIKVIFMEKTIACAFFRFDNEEIISTTEDHKNFFYERNRNKNEKKDNNEILNKLDELTGLKEVKKTISDQLTYFDYLGLKHKKGLAKKGKINLNSLFIGNPGTGKTLVAKLLGEIYKSRGLLSSGHVYEVGRPELVAEYIGHTAMKVKQAIERARGGILLIDEAYSLAREKDNKRDFGAEVIEVLIKEMSDGPGDIAIIAAGYPDEMNIFLDSNPGLKSRFKHKFHFKDYTPDELIKIAEYHCGKKNLSLTEGAREHLYKTIIKKWRNRDKTFGNARFVNELIDRAEMNLSLRVMKDSNIEKDPELIMTKLGVLDFDDSKKDKDIEYVKLPINEDELSEALKELNALRGLKKVKEDIENLTKLIRFYKEEGKDYMSNISLHSVFTGNPGTGKTTVARIMAKIYCALGILERGHLVECSRESLVSGYTGQTAIKTARLIEKAIGGVLFIDEAYSLTNTGDNDFGKEVIETLLKKMEDRRGEFIVIAAGYSVQMEHFMNSNPGLRSRFDKVMEFPDYDDVELIDIAFDLLKSNNLKIYDEISYFEFIIKVRELYKSKGENFANAREVRKLVEQIVINQNLRIARIPKSNRTDKIKSEVILEDYSNITFESPNNKQPLGFAKA